MRIQYDIKPRQRGAAALEFAVLLPFLLLMVVAGVDFARVYYYHLTLNNAARNGAVYASSHPDRAVNTEGIKQVVLDDTKNFTPDPTVSSNTTMDAYGTMFVTVTASWDFYTVIDYPGMSPRYTLTQSVEMRVANKAPKEPVYYP
jgi:Flp pilus assembly protein TadG